MGRYMNVVIVSLAFLPAEQNGGVPFSAFYLAESIKKLGNTVSVFTTNKNGTSKLNVLTNQWTTYKEIPVFYSEIDNSSYIKINSDKSVLSNLIRDSDLVISSSTFWVHLGLLAALYSIRYKKVHFVYLRGLFDSWALENRKLLKIIFIYTQGKLISKSATAFVALSNSEKESVLKVYPKSTVHVIPNGCPEVTVENNQLLGFSHLGINYKNYLLYIGRITKKKGLEQTISAFNMFNRNSVHKLLIAGPIDPDYEEEFNILMNNKSDSIVVLGPSRGELKSTLFASSRAVILTSKSEGMPMSILEAMAYGKPVIISSQCNLPEVSIYSAGWIVDHDDTNAISMAIKSCFENESLYAERSKNAENTARKLFAWSSVASSVMDLHATFYKNE
jgi:glycosyltransferase involved in cell wall biosynthesis